MDTSCNITLVALLMACVVRGMAENSQLVFLNKLLGKMYQEEAIETVLVLQHHLDKNCLLQGWNLPDIPILRSNQQIGIAVRQHFNHFSVGLVCISQASDTSLLDKLADNFDGMRRARIILLSQTKVTEEMLQMICHKVDKNQFLRMLILEMREPPKNSAGVLRLEVFPRPHFERVENILGIQEFIFAHAKLNYMGKTTYVLPGWAAPFKTYFKLPSNDTIPLTRIQDAAVVDFAHKYNLSLRVLNSTNTAVIPDIRLRTQVQCNITNIRSISPYDITSLKVVVPCTREWRIGEAFKRMEVTSLLLHIATVYAIFVVAETFILVVTHRISGQAYRLTLLNPLVNLRAFRAILGMPFPISRRASLSLHQLSLAISVFGLVFSNFFSCKLSALLTKHPYYPQVTNFEELQSSGLTVIAAEPLRPFIENSFGANLNLTKVEYQSNAYKLLLALNYSNAYFVFTENWNILDKYQKLFGRKTLCDSKELTIIQGLPMMYELNNNSIFGRPLFKYLVRLHEAGIMEQWTKISAFLLKTYFTDTFFYNKERRGAPLCVTDLKWVWYVLGCGHGLALIAFIVEILFGGRRRVSSEPTAHISMA